MPKSVAEAARELLDAFGGDIPDWLRSEAQALEDALEARMRMRRAIEANRDRDEA